MRLKCLVCSLLVLVAGNVFAERKIHFVADSGNTINIGEYFTKSEIEKKPDYTQDDLKNDLNATFPLKSELRLGKVYKKKTDVELPAPVVLVGTDDKSKAWLNMRLDLLKSVKPFILVIDCPSMDEFLAFKTTLKNAGFEVAHTNSAVFESVVDAYPVLINQGQIIQ